MILLTIGRHKQQQNHHQQISGIKISGENLSEEGQNVSALVFRRPFLSVRAGLRTRAFLWHRFLLLRWLRGWRWTEIRWRISSGWLRPFLRNTTSLKAAVGLRYISVIHGFTCLSVAAVLRHLETQRRILPFLLPAWPVPIC